MSGIVGIVNLDGAPLDRQLLDQLTAFMDFRGPDARNIWVDNNVGFGHTLLRASFQAANEKQPCSLNGHTWVTADVRIDGRADLIRQLRGMGREVAGDVTDPELILHAYDVWGVACVDHLIGDFCFAIWDAAKRELFCARDHYGVKPFFYAVDGQRIIFSNTFECVLRSLGGSYDLNDKVIAEFLLFGFELSPEETGIKQIRKLPPSHKITWKLGNERPKKYWELVAADEIRYQNPKDYIEHFRERLNEAITDRMCVEKVALSLSGGLDSTAIAAQACYISKQRNHSTSLHAFTAGYDSLIPDQEGHYSALAAQALGLPHSYKSFDRYGLFEKASGFKPIAQSPSDNPYWAANHDFLASMADFSRVVLNGQGGDEILRGDCVTSFLGKMSYQDLIKGLYQSLVHYRKRPALGIRAKLAGLLGCKKEVSIPDFPEWVINPELTKELDLKETWRNFGLINTHTNAEVRMTAYARIQPAYHWWNYLEGYDAGWTGLPIESRWPFLDIRLVSDLLAFPPLPLFIDKLILREMMRGVLPDEVRLRPKQPLAGSPHVPHMQDQGRAWDIDYSGNIALDKYLNIAKLKDIHDIPENTMESWFLLRPNMLYCWLKEFP